MFSNRDIARLIAKQMNLPPDKVLETLRRFQAAVIAEVASGGRLRLHGFGSFGVFHPRPIRRKVGLFRKRFVEEPRPPRLQFRFSPTFRKRVEAVTTPLTPPRGAKG